MQDMTVKNVLPPMSTKSTLQKKIKLLHREKFFQYGISLLPLGLMYKIAVRNMFFPSNWQKIYPVYQVSSATYITNYFSAIPASLGSFQRINSCYEKTCLMKCATSQDLTLQSLTTNFPVLSFCCVLMALRDRFSWNEVTYNP